MKRQRNGWGDNIVVNAEKLPNTQKSYSILDKFDSAMVELEQFADLLDVTMINLKEAGQHHKLGDDTL